MYLMNFIIKIINKVSSKENQVEAALYKSLIF